ncbi:MAG TPA: hypothetical protein VE935_00470 [Burkholderiales bacterium]|nr:hypothetical protein [Burkholderiales bacterium]
MSVAVLALAIFVLAAASLALHRVSKKHAEQQKVVEVLRDTTEQLRQALTPRASSSLVARIDEDLKGAEAPGDPALAEAAEEYIVGAREIARRRVEVERLERQAATNRAALEAHMTRGGRRNDAWFQSALALKKRVESDHFELDVTLKALDELLAGLPEAEKRLAPHVAAAVLLDESEREAARRQAQLQQKRATASLERVRALALP